MPYIAKSYHENQLVLDPKELKLRAKRESAVARCNKPMAVGRHTTHGTPPIGRPDYGPGEGARNPLRKFSSPLSPGRRSEATAQLRPRLV